MAARACIDESKKEAGDCKKADVSFRTTLSTSTSSFEALDPHDPQLNRLASQAFSGNKMIKIEAK